MKVPLKELVGEFKTFAFKGNMIDLAVAVVIGTAFSAVVASLVKHILMPIVSWPLGLISKAAGDYKTWHWGEVMIGQFIAEVVNFLLIAAAVFVMVVKLLGLLMKKGPPAVKPCPRCISDIPIAATRCKYCTSDVPAAG
jgi:large conductance mechanosensitive channel